jgi:hypothetical protein
MCGDAMRNVTIEQHENIRLGGYDYIVKEHPHMSIFVSSKLLRHSDFNPLDYIAHKFEEDEFQNQCFMKGVEYESNKV